jgi:WD40 repeat protein
MAHKTARLWDAATGAAIATLAGHSDSVNAVAFSPNGERVLTGSYDDTARPWPVFSSAQTGLIKSKPPRRAA